MKILLLFTKLLLSSAFWCQTFEFEYFNGNIASCIECESDLECSIGRQCWADAWCKTDVLCGDEYDNECGPLLPSPNYDLDIFFDPSPPPPLPSPPIALPSPPTLIPLHQYHSPYPYPPPHPPPPPSHLQSSDDMILKYFKEIGLPLIIAMIGLIGSMIGRNAVKHRKSKRRKRAQIQLQNMQNALDDDNLSDEASDSTEKV